MRIYLLRYITITHCHLKTNGVNLFNFLIFVVLILALLASIVRHMLHFHYKYVHIRDTYCRIVCI